MNYDRIRARYEQDTNRIQPPSTDVLTCRFSPCCFARIRFLALAIMFKAGSNGVRLVIGEFPELPPSPHPTAKLPHVRLPDFTDLARRLLLQSLAYPLKVQS